MAHNFLATPPTFFKSYSFRAYLADCFTADEASQLYKAFESTLLHPDQTAAPFAYRLGSANSTETEYSDDSGDIGVAEKLLFLLKRNNLSNALLIVARFEFNVIHPEMLECGRKFKFMTMVGKNVLDMFAQLSVEEEEGGDADED